METVKKLGAPAGNKNGAKEGELATSKLDLRVKRSDKARWVQAAIADGNCGLSAWVVKTLNNATHSHP